METVTKKYLKEEYGIRNYLDKHNIYAGNEDMQTVIINSFCNQRGQANDLTWKAKIDYVQKHFGLFAQYAQNNWKTVTN